MSLASVISKRIIAARTSKQWNQARLADMAGIAQATLSRYESGRNSRFDAGNLAKIANATEVSVDYLLGRID